MNEVLALIPATVYPKEYVTKLKKEVVALRKKASAKEAKTFVGIDNMFDSLKNPMIFTRFFAY